MSKGYALITGAARGLGKAIFLQLAKEGYDLVGVYATDTSTPKMQALIEALRACPFSFTRFSAPIRLLLSYTPLPPKQPSSVPR